MYNINQFEKDPNESYTIHLYTSEQQEKNRRVLALFQNQ